MTMTMRMATTCAIFGAIVVAHPIESMFGPTTPAMLSTYKVTRVLSRNEDPWKGGKQYVENTTVRI